MSDNTKAKKLMAEMYPVKMAAGGIIGDIGLLNAASMGLSPKYSPQEREYMDAYQQYQNVYNTEYLPAYEKIRPQYEQWVTDYNKAVEGISAGQYDQTRKLDYDDDDDWAWLANMERAGYTNVGDLKYARLRPSSVGMVFSTPEPKVGVPEPVAPTPPPGLANEELAARQVQLAKRRSGLAVFGNPEEYNLAGFGGTSAFAKGGEVKEPIDIKLAEQEALLTLGPRPSEGGLSYKDYPNPYGLRAYPKGDGYGGEMLPKYIGWAGEQEGRGNLQGSRVTEYSMEDEKGSFPIINPLLSREEIELVASGIVTPSIYNKAVQWRDSQAAQGESAFLNPPNLK